MIKKATRILSMLLVLLNLLSFIPTVVVSSASSEGNTSAGDLISGSASGIPGAGDSRTLNGAGGYRIYLTRSDIIDNNITTNSDGTKQLHWVDNHWKFRSTGYLNMYKN